MYGASPRSYLYDNDGRGHFTDVTGQVAPGLFKIGMVTGALWRDVEGDARKELIVSGEWMSPRIFRYKDRQFTELHDTGLDQLYGWWQTLSAGDVNGDGREDLIIGNIGENFYLKPDAAHPVRLWVTDFDGNGEVDQFLTRTVEGRDVPVFLKREITEQFPGLKKDNLKHSDYARKSIQDLFPAKLLAGSEKRLFNYCSSIVAINEGKGHFTARPLPYQVQLSSVNAILPTDINEDGKTDLLLSGNLFGFPPQFGRLDASYGHVLLGDGRGGFQVMEQAKTGLLLKGEGKDIQQIQTAKGKRYLFTQNDQAPVLMKKREKPV